MDYRFTVQIILEKHFETFNDARNFQTSFENLVQHDYMETKIIPASQGALNEQTCMYCGHGDPDNCAKCKHNKWDD